MNTKPSLTVTYEENGNVVISHKNVKLEVSVVNDQFVVVHKVEQFTQLPFVPVKVSTMEEIEAENIIKRGKPIHKELVLPTRIMNSIKAENMYYMNDLLNLSKKELMKMPNFGKDSYQKLVAAAESAGYKFTGSQD